MFLTHVALVYNASQLRRPIDAAMPIVEVQRNFWRIMSVAQATGRAGRTGGLTGVGPPCGNKIRRRSSAQRADVKSGQTQPNATRSADGPVTHGIAGSVKHFDAAFVAFAVSNQNHRAQAMRDDAFGKSNLRPHRFHTCRPHLSSQLG